MSDEETPERSATFVYMRDAVGIRELRQDLSTYLGRVETGESFVVTDRNRPVAELRPLGDSGPVERLLASNRVSPPARAALDFSPVKLRGRAHLATASLEVVRGERG